VSARNASSLIIPTILLFKSRGHVYHVYCLSYICCLSTSLLSLPHLPYCMLIVQTPCLCGSLSDSLSSMFHWWYGVNKLIIEEIEWRTFSGLNNTSSERSIWNPISWVTHSESILDCGSKLLHQILLHKKHASARDDRKMVEMNNQELVPWLHLHNLVIYSVSLSRTHGNLEGL